jgi:hypothetical protein
MSLTTSKLTSLRKHGGNRSRRPTYGGNRVLPALCTPPCVEPPDSGPCPGNQQPAAEQEREADAEALAKPRPATVTGPCTVGAEPRGDRPTPAGRPRDKTRLCRDTQHPRSTSPCSIAAEQQWPGRQLASAFLRYRCHESVDWAHHRHAGVISRFVDAEPLYSASARPTPEGDSAINSAPAGTGPHASLDGSLAPVEQHPRAGLEKVLRR